MRIFRPIYFPDPTKAPPGVVVEGPGNTLWKDGAQLAAPGNTTGTYWGELTVANLPTEEDGVKPGDIAWVTDALTLDGTGGLFVYDQEQGWIEHKTGVPATTDPLDAFRLMTYAPYGSYKNYQVLPIWTNLVNQSGSVINYSPLSNFSDYGGGAGVRGDVESKALLFSLGAPNTISRIVGSRLYRARFKIQIDKLSNISSPNDGQICAIAFIGWMGRYNYKGCGLIIDIQYASSDTSWHFRLYPGTFDYDAITASKGDLIDDITINNLNSSQLVFDVAFAISNYTTGQNNLVHVWCKKAWYDIDMSSVDEYYFYRTPAQAVWIDAVGSSNTILYLFEQPGAFIPL